MGHLFRPPGRVAGIGGSSHHEGIKNSLDPSYPCPGSGTDWRLAGRWGGGATLGDKLYRWGCQGPGGQAISGCNYPRSNPTGKKVGAETPPERALLSGDAAVGN